MKVSQNFIKLIEELEGRRRNLYYCSAGAATIGIGHKLTQKELSSGILYINGERVDYRNGLTDRQIDDLLRQDVKNYEDAVNSSVRVPLNQNQFDALVRFCFNVGIGAFQSSTLLKVLNEGNYGEVPNQLRRWKYSKGKVIQGLVNRRDKEIALWKESAEIKPEKDILLAQLAKIKEAIAEIEKII